MSMATHLAANEPASAAGTSIPRLSRWVPALALAVLAGHVVVNVVTPYGLHRDAFLYLAMGRHLRPWRMDFPPLIAMIAQVERGLLGDSLVSIRLVPALSHAALVLMAGLVARELRGRGFAQAFAALGVTLGSVFLRPGALFQPVALDQLWWTAGLYALARMARRRPGEAPREWLALGVACGLGLLTKFSILFFGLGVLIGALLSDRRRDLATPWPWMAAALALAIGAPSLVGQIRLDWPVLGQMRDLQSVQLERVSPLDFLLGQVMLLGPWIALATAGLLELLLSERNRRFRAVGWTCAAAFLTLLALHGKAYYAAPVYPALLAAGAVAFERITARRDAGADFRPGRPRLLLGRRAAIALGIAFGAFALPMGLPILPAPLMARYAAGIGVTAAVTTNRGEVLPLPQDYADMLGWPALADTVARVWRSLPPAARARAVLVANNYGEAGALDFYGERLGLPPSIAPTGSYWFFGPGRLPGEVAVIVGGDEAGNREYFADVRLAATMNEPWVVPEERGVPVWVARDPYRPLQQVWGDFEGRN